MAGQPEDGPPDWFLGTAEAPITLSHIPEMNQTFLGSCEDQSKFVKLFKLLYSTLHKKSATTQGGANINYIYCSWMDQTDDVIQNFADLGLVGLTRVHRHPIWLLKFILSLINSNVNYTRALLEQLVPHLEDTEVNALLIQ